MEESILFMTLRNKGIGGPGAAEAAQCLVRALKRIKTDNPERDIEDLICALNELKLEVMPKGEAIVA